MAMCNQWENPDVADLVRRLVRTSGPMHVLVAAVNAQGVLLARSSSKSEQMTGWRTLRCLAMRATCMGGDVTFRLQDLLPQDKAAMAASQDLPSLEGVALVVRRQTEGADKAEVVGAIAMIGLAPDLAATILRGALATS